MNDATPKTESSWIAPLLYLLGAGSLVGVMTNLAKLAGEVGLSPLAFLTWSAGGATLVLLVLNYFRGDLPKLNARTVEYFLTSGLVTVALTNLIFFAATPRLGAGFVALAITLPPLTTYAGSLLVGLESFRWSRAVGVLLSLGGAALLAYYKLSDPEADTFWIVMVLVAVLGLTAGNIYRTTRWPEGAEAAELAPGMIGAAFLQLLVFGTLAAVFGWNPDLFSLGIDFSQPDQLYVIGGQIAVYATQLILFFRLQKTGGPVYLSLLGSVGAIVGVPVAVLLLGENWPEGLVIGGLLIAAGIGLLTYGGAHQED